jgi:hypothetical protein
VKRLRKKLSELGGMERARDGRVRIDASNRRADDRKEVGPERAERTRQLTLFGSDQADNRVTKSNSRRSFDTT